jgi:hypothetical protein
MTGINRQLQSLAGLWTDPTTENLAKIPALCNSIEEMIGRNTGRTDPSLIFRARLLAAKAQQRIEECVAIQTRTGAYSMCGAHELSPRVATIAWEG